MADESLEDILTNIDTIGNDSEESETESLGQNTIDYVDNIDSQEEFINILGALSTEDSSAPTEDNSVTYLGALGRGIKDSMTNKVAYAANNLEYALTRDDNISFTDSLVTAGDRTKSGQLNTEWKQLLYSGGHELANLAQNIGVALKFGTVGAAGGGAASGPAAPVGAAVGGALGASTGYAISAGYNSLVMGAEVFKDSYNDAIDRGYKESDAWWEALEKSGATMGLEYFSQFVPVGGKYAGKAVSKLLPDLVKNGIAKVEKGIVKILDKSALRKVLAGATAKEAVKETAEQTTKKTVGTVAKEIAKEGTKGGVEEYGEEYSEDLVHQIIEIANDPNKTLEDLSFKQAHESGKGGLFVGSSLRIAAPHIQKGMQKGAQLTTEAKDRYKYGKKVSEEITTVDEKKLNVTAREKTIEQAKRQQEYESAADKQSVAQTNIENKIIDTEGKAVDYTDIKDDEQYIFRNNKGVEQAMSGKEAKQAWKTEYAKNKEVHKKDIIAKLAGKDAINELFSVKNSKGEDVTTNPEFNAEEEYEVTFAGKPEKVTGDKVQELRNKYLEESISSARTELGIGHLNKSSDKPVVSQQVADVLTRRKQYLNNIQDFYNSHQVINLENGQAVNPTEVTPEGRYKVVTKDGKVVNEETSGLGVSILEKYSPIHPANYNDPEIAGITVDPTLVNLSQRGDSAIRKSNITIGKDNYSLQRYNPQSKKWELVQWKNLDSFSPDTKFRLLGKKTTTPEYTSQQLKAFKNLATRHTTIANEEFINKHKLYTTEGNEVSWDSLYDPENNSLKYNIEHEGSLIGTNLSNESAKMYREMANDHYIKKVGDNTYIYMKAASQYKGAPGTLYVRSNDPTNTTYIGDNTDLMGDTSFDFERDILSAKQRQKTRLAILKAIKAQKNTEQNVDEATNLGESDKQFVQTDADDKVLERQSEFLGGANPESFGQVIEYEWADDFIFSKPDTAPATREEIAYTIDSDVKSLVDLYKGDIQKVVKGDTNVLIGKEHLRSILSNLAKNLGYKMLNDLGEKGIAGKHVKDNVKGSIVAKYKYFRIRNSRDYQSGLHELGHGIFRDGLWGEETNQLSTTNDSTTFVGEMDSLFSNKVQSYSSINLSAYDQNNPYALAEEKFCEAVMVLATNPEMEKVFKQYAPTTFKALDNYLTKTNSWAHIKQMQVAAKYYVEQSPLQRAIANLTRPNRNVFGQVFSPTWWKNICFKKIAADIMSYTTDDMAGARYMAERLGVPEGSDELEFVRSIGNDNARRLIAGDGCNFAGQSLKGFGFKNLKEVLGPIYEKLGKDGLSKLKALLWAQATLGENIGNERVLAHLRKLSAKQQNKFTDSFKVMRGISNLFWEEFIKKEDTQAGDVSDVQEWNLSAQDIADMINSYKKAARELLTNKDISDAKENYDLQKELESIKKEKDPALKVKKLEAWQETVLKEALRQNFKHKMKQDIADTGMSIVDAIINYDSMLINDKNASLYAQAAQDYHDFQNVLLHHIAGASSEMKFYAERMMKNASGWHAPLLRQFSSDEEAVSPNYLLAKREGSDRAVSDLYENTIKQVIALCDVAAKSAMKEFMVKLVDNTGSGLYIRELTEPSEQVSVKIQDIKEAMFKERDARLQELRDRGVQINTKITDAVNNVMAEAENLHLTTLSLFSTTSKVDKEHCQFSYFDPSENKMRFFETEGSIYQALEKPTYSNAVRRTGDVLRWLMIGMKLNLITINPAFLLLTNPVRDTFTLGWKGDTPLIRTGNRFLDTNPINTIPGAIYYVAQTYMDYVLHRGNPDIFKVMDMFGVGYNSRNNSYKNFQKMVQNDPSIKYLSSNPLKAMLQIGEAVVDSLGNLDKLARVAQLKAMLKRDGLSVDNFNVNRRNVAAMVLEKQVLLANGINQDIIDKYLTPEQRTIWENAKDDETPVLDLTLDQTSEIYKAINPNDLHMFTKEQRIQYAKALRLCTTDFARGGAMLRGLNKFLLFVQPAFNGTAQSVERIKMRIATGHGDEVLANIITTFAAGLAYQYLLPDDEDESEEEMWKGVKVPIGDSTWRAPVLAEDMWWFQAARYLMKDSPKDYQKFIMSFFRNINPFGSSGPIPLALSMFTGKRLNDISDSRFAQSIVPDYMTKTMGTKHPELFYNESTSALARLAGRFVRSPMEIQYFMDQTGLSIWDNIIEDMMGVRRVTRTQGGIDINNPSRRWTDLQNMVGINTHPYKTRSQEALSNLLNEARGEYYTIPQYKRKHPVGLTRRQYQIRQNYLSLNQVDQTIGIFNKLESIAIDPNDRAAIKKQKTAYMQNILKKLEKVPGMEGKYYYQLSLLRKQKQRQLDWKERALTAKARKEADTSSPGIFKYMWDNLLGVSEAQAEPLEGVHYLVNQKLDKTASTGNKALIEQLIKGNQPSTGVVNDEIKQRVPEYVNSKGEKYRPNELQQEVRDDIQKTLQTNIASAVNKTILSVAMALEQAGSPTRSSIRQLKVSEVMNNETFKRKLKNAYKTPITFKDVSEAIAETLVEKTIKYPVTAKHESKGKLWSTKPQSKKVTIKDENGVEHKYEVGGFGIYQLDPWAKGGHEKMRNYINQSAFKQPLSEAFDSTKPEGIDYKKLSDTWTKLSKDPITAEAFAKDYEAFMEKEYMPKAMLDEYERAGFDINNRQVRDAIFAFSVQMPSYAKSFAESLPTSARISNTAAVNKIMDRKVAIHPKLSRYVKERKELLTALGE